MKELLNNCEIFRSLTAQQMEKYSRIFIPETFDQDEYVFMQGDIAANLYVISHGEVHIQYKPYDGPEMIVTKLFTGGIFGWSSAIGSDFYTSSAISNAPSVIYRVSGSDLRRIYENDVEVGVLLLENLAGVIAKRLRNTHAEVLNLIRNGILEGVPSGGVR